ncbi:hypothetical protein RF11_03527 [Thelohanellus kitauei]|uniref:Tc1-like transposase DDE domain-containing protein n=1 Tax=Thelohanellus kitauei TaxID=669202 RepID=A0A0C2MVR7_THEKT|nr:hypothetical protein RF11_03527 [Thelohanellus kitauei]
MNRYGAVYKKINSNLLKELKEKVFWDMSEKQSESTKFQQFQTALQKNGQAVSNLLPYSPFLKPIDKVFSKWKGCAKSHMLENETKLLNSMKEGLANSMIRL